MNPDPFNPHTPTSEIDPSLVALVEDRKLRDSRIAEIDETLRESPGFLAFVMLARRMRNFGWLPLALMALAAVGIPYLIGR